MTVHTPIEKLDPADAKVRRELKTLLHPARGRRAAWIGAFLILIVGAWCGRYCEREGTTTLAAPHVLYDAPALVVQFGVGD